jgi:eukaryotic-like serine/threonine-protein kinase
MNNLSGRQFGNYRLLRLLGQGGFADTYLAEQIYVHTQAAVKIVQTQFGQGDQESFFNEARMIAHLNHPNIVRLIDFGVSDSRNTPYLIMEYAPNGTLRQRHPRGEVVPIERVVQYVRNIAAALQYAHAQKVIHRDVKPENMLIAANQEILLADFGIAVVQSSRVQSLNNVAGTVSYMAPEQIQGHAVPASDQYALAVVVYEWLCGAPLFTGSYAEIAAQHTYATPQPPRQRVATISAEVEQVVLMALSKDPQWRFKSVEAFANAFAQASKADSGRQQVPLLDSQADIPTMRGAYSDPYAGSQPTVPALQPQTAYGFPQDRQEVDFQNPPPPPPMYAVPAGTYNPQTPPPTVPASFTPQMVHNTPQYTPPNYGGQVGLTPTPPSASRKRQPSNLLLFLLAAAIVLVVGSVAIVYAAVYRPFIQGVQVTATVNAQTTGTALAQANATGTVVAQVSATQTALQNIYAQATSGAPGLDDPLKNPDNYGWSHYTSSTGTCNYINGVYHSRTPVGYFAPCYASATNFSDFAFQAQVKTISGVLAGIMYRAPNINNDYSGYYFEIGTDGSYHAYKVTVDKQGHNNFPTLVSGSSPAIHSGLNQTNLLAVVARGNALYFYVNKQYVNKATDSDYKGGVIGVFTDSSDTGGTEAVFSNVQVWQLS